MLFFNPTVKPEEFLSFTETLLEAAPDAVIVIDNNGRIVKWNAKSETLFGWTSDEVIGKLLSKTIIPHRYREAHERGLKYFLETGEGPILNKTIEIYAINKNNVEFNVALSISPVIVQNKHLFIGFVHDITARKIAEEKLLKLSRELEQKVLERTEELSRSERKYHYLFENNPMPMWVIDLDTFKFLDVNEMAILQYGYSREEFLSMTTLDIRPDEDKELFIQHDHLCEMRGTNYDKGIWNHRKKDGTIIQVETIAHKIIFEGVPARFVLSNDITEKKKAEEKIKASEKKFRSLIENSSEVIIISDRHGKRLFVSEGINRMLGYTPEEFIQFNIFDSVLPEEAHSIRLVLKEVVDSPHHPFTINFHIRHKNGSWHWIEAVLAGFFDVQDLNGIVINYRDVTERKKAEQDINEARNLLIKSEKQYRNLFENNPMPMWVIAIDTFQFLDVNEAATLHYGYSREEFLSMTAVDIRPEEEKELYKNADHSKSAYPANYNWGSWRHLKKDGTLIYVEIIVHDIIFDGKKARLILSNDITEKRKVEEKLKKSVKEITDYKFALDESSIVAITDQKGIIKHVNDNFCKISKYLREELIGQDHRIVNSGYHPKEFIRNLWVTIANGKIWKGEFKNKAKDGTTYWADTTIVPFLNEQGKPYQYVAIKTDITERKKADEQLLFHIENAPLGFIEWDNHGFAKAWSKRAEEIFGWGEKEFIESQKKGFIQVYKEDLPWVGKILEQLISGEVKRNKVQYRNITKDGRVIWCEWFNSVLKGEDGKVKTIMSLVQDISEQKQLERQKDNFLSTASHELKTPVTTIKAYAQIVEGMLETKDDVETLSMVKKMISQVNKLTNLVEDLLDVTKIQIDKLIYNEDFFDFNELVKEVIDDMQKISTHHKIKNNSGESAKIFGDRDKLSQLLNNLISNATKYSPKANSVVVSAELQKDGIKLSVQDFGIGILSRDQKNVFNQFYRITGDNQSTFPGMGISLYICSEIISRHGGKIWVESTIGKGSTFYIWIPFDHRNKAT